MNDRIENTYTRSGRIANPTEQVEWKKMWEVTAWDKKFQGVEKYMQKRIIAYKYLLAKDLFALSVPNGNIKLLSTGVQEGWTTEELAGNLVSEGEVVTIPWGKSPGAQNPVKYYKGKFVTGDNRIATSLDTNLLSNKFLYYWMYSKSNTIETFYRGAGIQHPSMFKVLNMAIPIPSIEEQNRIVGILDTFTDSIENLKQQIAQRRKQFEFYRDLYINMSFSKWPTITLKDIAVIKNGKDYKDLSTGNVPVYGSGGIMTFVNAFASDKPSVLLPRKGSVENIFYVDKPFWTVDTIYWTDIDTNRIEPKFLFYSLSKYDLKKFAYGGARPSLSQPILYKLEIPLPPLSEQQRIVSILDTFEASISNLEAQLAQRQKQYEYYRNQLLTFE